jgi:hypothetical protein
MARNSAHGPATRHRPAFRSFDQPLSREDSQPRATYRRGGTRPNYSAARPRTRRRNTFGEKVQINTFNRATGYRLKRHMVDSITSDIVENEEIARGYSVAKDRYGQVEDNEPAEILIEIEQFTPKASVDDRYRDTPLYLAPEGRGGARNLRGHPWCNLVGRLRRVARKGNLKSCFDRSGHT